jgi:glycosyltransferase involved in cell wall biosynthesis
MRIVIVTDAWHPQVNGVVRSLQSIAGELAALGHQIQLISPDLFRSVPCPTYGEIRLALAGPSAVGRRIESFEPDAIHIATEGPLGVAARIWCLRRGHAFTTAYHTHFPDYIARRTRLPARWFWTYFRWFHRRSRSILVSTPTVARQLADQGLAQTRRWSRGVDLTCFNPDATPHPALANLPRPILLYVGRIAVEKNIAAFLDLLRSGSKIVVGEGPDFLRLKRRYPQVSFLGALHGADLAGAYAAADVLVFPSRTDTFGLVMIEALACGTPVAAFPVPGPRDILTKDVGRIDERLGAAIDGALQCERRACAEFGRQFSWRASAQQFASALAPLRDDRASVRRLELNSPISVR